MRSALTRLGRGLGTTLALLLKLALWIAVLGGIGVGVYLLAFREEEQGSPEYRYTSVLGGEREPSGCLLSDRRPRVRIGRERDRRGFGEGMSTTLEIAGGGAIALEDDCEGAEPAIRFNSLRIILPGGVAVTTTEVSPPKRPAKGKGGGKKGGSGKGGGKGGNGGKGGKQGGGKGGGKGKRRSAEGGGS